MVDLQNRILLYHAEKQQESQSGKDVYRLPRKQQRKDPERNSQRQRQQNGDGVDKGFELRRQNHVHKDKRKHECDHEVITSATELFRTTGQAGLVGTVDIYLFGEIVELLNDRRLRTAGFDIGQQGYLSLTVEAIDRRGTSALFQPYQIVQADPANLARRDNHPAQAFLTRTILSYRTHPHIVLIGSSIEG